MNRMPRFLHSCSPVGVSLLTLACVLCFAIGTTSADNEYRQAMAKAVRDSANRVLPSVVSIEIIGTAEATAGEVEQDAPTSAVIIDNDGFLLASSIVVQRPSASILAVLPDGTRHAAKVIARDYHRDLVLLKIETEKPLQAIEFPSTLDLKIGQTTVAVGRFGSDLAPIISRGVLSGRERLDGVALQTDARVSPAFYGGPLIDLYGQVIGILIPAVAKGGAPDSTSWYDSGIAFAIPSDVILKKVARLKSGTDIKPGFIGIAAKTKDPYDDGTEISAVRKRSPAEASGIKAGDEVVEVDGRSVRRHQEIKQALGKFDAGETILIKLRRDGKEFEIETELAESIPPLQPQRLGILASERAGETEEADPEVYVEAIVPNTVAAEKLEPGDRILKLGDAEVTSMSVLRSLLISAEPETELSLALDRQGNELTVKLTPESIAGPALKELPQQWVDENPGNWGTEEIKLPDAGNQAAYLAPEAGDNQESLGLLVLLLNPGQDAPRQIVDQWRDAAMAAGVAVCAIAPEDPRRWQPKEINAVANFAAAVMKKTPINPTAVAVAAPGSIAGLDAEAADSMALAVAISQSSTFFGVSVSPKTRSPAVRLKENDPSTSLQLLLPVSSEQDLPEWSVGIQRAGYPVVRGGKTNFLKLLTWVRLLQAI